MAPVHDPLDIGCTSCHGGDPDAVTEQSAHTGLEAYPGRMSTVAKYCGQASCHEEQVAAARNSIMNTVDGMVELTRRAFGKPPAHDRDRPLGRRLATTGVDSYLRKLCVSCHLGSERTKHGQRLTDRGGGCSACHLETFPQPEDAGAHPAPPGDPPGRVRTGVHPRLTVRIDNQRCFGCHSRSGRISLNYVGLAETAALDPKHPESFGHLPDGRLVKKQVPDVHSQAGLSCIDCHTATGVMGTGERVHRQRDQLDIACEDCHTQPLAEKPLAEMTRREILAPLLYGWNTPDMATGRIAVTRRRGTPLFNLYRKRGEVWLHKKVFGTEVQVPPSKPGPHHDLKGHERLTCDACHSAWAPQCDGCHIAYDPTARQWDHLLRKDTPGRWVERLWSVRSDPPALGVRDDGRIVPFVPGMPVIRERGDGRPPERRVVYSRISPHTTRKEARTCKSCHTDKHAMGLIVGQAVAPWDPSVRLPIGWVDRDAPQPGRALHEGDRSFNREEIGRIQRVGGCLRCHAGSEPFYADFGRAMGAIGDARSHAERFERQGWPKGGSRTNP